jgi:hypothetical protein
LSGSAFDWPSWTVIPPCLLTILVGLLGLLVGCGAEAFKGINSEGVQGGPPLNGGWIAAGVLGAIAAMLAAVFLARSDWPRGVAALAIWGVLVLQVGWMSLAFYLVAH